MKGELERVKEQKKMYEKVESMIGDRNISDINHDYEQILWCEIMLKRGIRGDSKWKQ